jgi:biopolymer transport protein ExbD
VTPSYIPLPVTAPKARFELTALIDVIFILVLFFAVSSSFTREKQALSLTLPTAVAVETPPASVVIAIDKNQRLFWNGDRITDDGMRQSIQKTLVTDRDKTFVIQADEATPYRQVVRVLDTIRNAGGLHVMLETQPLR